MLKIFSFLKKYGKEIAIGLFVIMLLKKFSDFNLFNTNSKDNLTDKDKLPINTNNITISDVEAKTIAENLYSALVGTAFGTDEDLAYAQFERMKTKDDFNKVFNAFGKRQYSFTFGNMGDPVTSENQDLVAIMTNEFNESEQQYIRTKYPYLGVF